MKKTTKATTRRAKKKAAGNPRGLAPPDALAAKRAAEGYATPAELGRKYEVPEQTIYKWARGWRPTKENEFGRSFEGKLGAFKDGVNLWVLEAAVAARVSARRGAPA